MYTIAFWIAVGIIIGWNFRQPKWAKVAEAKVLEWLSLAWAWVKAKVAGWWTKN
jgi:hypothetical protein